MPANPLSAERQAQIMSLVETIKLSTGLFYPKYSVSDIIKASIPGVSIKEYDFKGDTSVRGAIYRKGKKYDQPIISVNSAQSDREKNFTLAHEFAHYMLEHDGEANFYIDNRPFDGSDAMQNEGEANFFASLFLMPKDKFVELDLPFVSDAQLAERFGVPEGAIGVRRNWIRRNGF